MKLQELFQTFYPYDKQQDNIYFFRTPAGKRYRVKFDKVEIPYKGEIRDAIWISFLLIKSEYKWSDEVESTGDAFAVFSTVGTIVQDYMSRSAADIMVLAGWLDQTSRIKLYETFIKHLPKFMPEWKYEYTQDDIMPGIRAWIIKRKGSD